MKAVDDSSAAGGGPLNRLTRGRFLRLAGASLAGATVLAKTAFAREGGSALEAEFREAAERYDVPAEVLMAMGWINTRLEMPPPDANEYEPGDLHGWGSYGIMALTQNPSSDTLGEASRLTGIPERKLKTDRRSNILGGAAVLASSRGARRPGSYGEYAGIVGGRGGSGRSYRAVTGVGAGEDYARAVMEKVAQGIDDRSPRGERVAFRGRRLAERIVARTAARAGGGPV